jgi:hypothetical protein
MKSYVFEGNGAADGISTRNFRTISVIDSFDDFLSYGREISVFILLHYEQHVFNFKKLLFRIAIYVRVAVPVERLKTLVSQTSQKKRSPTHSKLIPANSDTTF